MTKKVVATVAQHSFVQGSQEDLAELPTSSPTGAQIGALCKVGITRASPPQEDIDEWEDRDLVFGRWLVRELNALVRIRDEQRM